VDDAEAVRRARSEAEAREPVQLGRRVAEGERDGVAERRVLARARRGELP